MGNNPDARWSQICLMMGKDRTAKQCRERWINHLNPNILKRQWNKREEWFLYLFQKNMGNRWTEISKCFRQRGDNDIKNHWYSNVCKKNEFYSKCLERILRSKEAFLSKKFDDLERLLMIKARSMQDPSIREAIDGQTKNGIDKDINIFKVFEVRLV